MSGISVSDALLELYEQVKLRKAHKFVVFSLKKTDTTGRTYEWQIDYTAPPNDDIGANKAEFERLVGMLPEADPCFAVFDFNETSPDGRIVKKLVLIKWCPDSVHFRVKTVIGGSYQTLKEKLTGLGADIQASDTSDLTYEAVKKALV